MLCKCSGKYIDIYFNLKITFHIKSSKALLTGIKQLVYFCDLEKAFDNTCQVGIVRLWYFIKWFSKGNRINFISSFLSDRNINPFSAKLIFGRGKEKKSVFLFKKFYSYFSFYAREKKFKYFFSLANWLNFFIETWKKKIETPAKYELFLTQPLNLDLVLVMFVMSCGIERVKVGSSH